MIKKLVGKKDYHLKKKGLPRFFIFFYGHGKRFAHFKTKAEDLLTGLFIIILKSTRAAKL